MKIKILKRTLFLLAFIGVLMSCNNDDDNTNTTPIRDRAEQQIADSDSLIAYLSSHYYNSAFFETGSNHKYTDIVITELEEGETVPDGHTLLIDAVGDPLTTTFAEADYEYYVLRLNQGGGEAPRYTDAIRYRFEGSLLATGAVFQNIATPSSLPLTGVTSTTGAVRAWQLAMPTFNQAVDFTIGNDGIVNYNNYGLGVIFVPSGLAYFSAARTGIPSYSNLIFKFELLQVEVNDYDNDGIPSYIEDLDDDNDVFDNDTDEDGLANFIDSDDDGDGVTTNDELSHTQYIVDTNLGENEPVLGTNEFEVSRTEVSGVITINTVTLVDSNNDGVFDYLDEDIAINNNI